MSRIIFFPFAFALAFLVSLPALGQSVQLADDAPDVYTVQRGDTLWGISGRFLRQPWRWPEVWRLNREQIANPHLIFPGQVIMLDRSGPYLSIARPVGASSGEIRPHVRHEALDREISSIPLRDIEPFLNRSLIIEQGDIEGAGTIVATDEQRDFVGVGDTVFASGVDAEAGVWQVFRRPEALVDPLTKELLAYEAEYIGTARMVAPADPSAQADGKRGAHGGIPAALEIMSAVAEIGPGDRLVISERPQVFAHVPRAPEQAVEGRLISLYRGVVATGRHSIVTLNLGSRDGLAQGHVLALYRDRGEASHTENRQTTHYRLPDQRYGLLFVFEVFDRVAYALVMDADGAVSVGDFVRQP